MNHVGPREVEREVPGKWKARGNCVGKKTAIFYPVTEDGEALAKAICVNCPVQRQCLEFAIRNREQGIWGGTTEWERGDGQRRRRGRPPKAKSRHYAREAELPRDKGRYVTPDGRRKSSLPPPGPNPLCGCGCGEEVSWTNGVWSRWKRGHANRIRV